jgi:hypothetical protein
MLAQLDAGPVVLRAVRRTLVAGPTVADQPRQRRRRPDTDLIR